MASFGSGNRARDEDSFLDWEGRATLFEDDDASEDEADDEVDEEDDAPRPRAGKGRGARLEDPDLEARDDDDEEDEDDDDEEDAEPDDADDEL